MKSFFPTAWQLSIYSRSNDLLTSSSGIKCLHLNFTSHGQAKTLSSSHNKRHVFHLGKKLLRVILIITPNAGIYLLRRHFSWVWWSTINARSYKNLIQWVTSGLLFAPLYNAFNNGSRGFTVSSQLPGCLLLFWVAYFLARAHVMNNSVWLCAAKPNSILEALLYVCGWSSLHSDSAREVPITGLQDWQIKRLWHIQPALHEWEQVINI